MLFRSPPSQALSPRTRSADHLPSRRCLLPCPILSLPKATDHPLCSHPICALLLPRDQRVRISRTNHQAAEQTRTTPLPRVVQFSCRITLLIIPLVSLRFRLEVVALVVLSRNGNEVKSISLDILRLIVC